MKTIILYNKDLKWWWISNKAIIILPSDELLNKYNLIPPVNRDDIINHTASYILWWNDFDPCYTGKNLLTNMTMLTKRMRYTKIENINYNKYNEEFTENILKQFVEEYGSKVFGYIIVDFNKNFGEESIEDFEGIANEELIYVRCNKKLNDL